MKIFIMELTILEVLYIVIIMFLSVVWTLLSIALYKLIKILDVALELVVIYNKIKQVLSMYAQIPEMIKQKIMELLSSKKEEKVWEEDIVKSDVEKEKK